MRSSLDLVKTAGVGGGIYPCLSVLGLLLLNLLWQEGQISQPSVESIRSKITPERHPFNFCPPLIIDLVDKACVIFGGLLIVVSRNGKA
jgi:hypothetical protein